MVNESRFLWDSQSLTTVLFFKRQESTIWSTREPGSSFIKAGGKEILSPIGTGETCAIYWCLGSGVKMDLGAG